MRGCFNLLAAWTTLVALVLAVPRHATDKLHYPRDEGQLFDKTLTLHSKAQSNSTVVVNFFNSSSTDTSAHNGPITGQKSRPVTVDCTGYETSPAFEASCRELIVQLISNTLFLLDDYRGVCLSLGGTSCCTTWSRHVKGIPAPALVASLIYARKECGQTSHSAHIQNVTLGDIVVDQCVDDDPIKCWR
jgi:hypothetical protein